MLALGETDTNTVVDFSVMIYYTSEFKAMQPNVEDYVNLMMTETNTGYENSGVKARIHPHCIEQLDIEELDDSTQMRINFRKFKG